MKLANVPLPTAGSRTEPTKYEGISPRIILLHPLLVPWGGGLAGSWAPQGCPLISAVWGRSFPQVAGLQARSATPRLHQGAWKEPTETVAGMMAARKSALYECKAPSKGSLSPNSPPTVPRWRSLRFTQARRRTSARRDSLPGAPGGRQRGAPAGPDIPRRIQHVPRREGGRRGRRRTTRSVDGGSPSSHPSGPAAGVLPGGGRRIFSSSGPVALQCL